MKYRDPKLTSREIILDCYLPRSFDKDAPFLSCAAKYLDMLRTSTGKRRPKGLSDLSLGLMIADIAWDCHHIDVRGPSPDGFLNPPRVGLDLVLERERTQLRAAAILLQELPPGFNKDERFLWRAGEYLEVIRASAGKRRSIGLIDACLAMMMADIAWACHYIGIRGPQKGNCELANGRPHPGIVRAEKGLTDHAPSNLNAPFAK
jgi:hypothetical protein